MNGPDHPDGTTFTATLPNITGGGFVIQGNCVEGVHPTFSVRGVDLATVHCVLGQDYPTGLFVAYVNPSVAERFGLRPGHRAEITVRRSGRDTDQWRVNVLT